MLPIPPGGGHALRPRKGCFARVVGAVLYILCVLYTLCTLCFARVVGAVLHILCVLYTLYTLYASPVWSVRRSSRAS